jgi:putative Ca2+/H+ antiporter (TMEM165/GDT1 family)
LQPISGERKAYSIKQNKIWGGKAMDWKVFLTTFGTIFLAELGDKTQLATIMMTSKTKLPLSVFIGASLALCLVTLAGVLFGEGLIAIIPQNILKKVAALAFIAIGVWMFVGK